MATPESLCNDLARTKLFSPDEARSLLLRWRGETRDASDGEAFSQWLVQQGSITEYQRGMVMKGKLDRCRVGDYFLLDRIGQGRMAGVYKARSKSGQSVAVKILPPSKIKDAEAFGRFQRESRMALKLKHPNVVRTFEVGQDDNLHFLVMEYLEGETLEEVLKSRKQLPAPEALKIVHQALLGLQHLHEQDVVHRDLKPANLMLAETGGEKTVKILDVGLGKALFDEGDGMGPVDLTNQGDLIGEPDYMAPEQARSASTADIRSDIYSLGCVLYHAITGSVPFPSKNAVQKLMMHAKEKAKPLAEWAPQTPAVVQGLVDAMMAKEASMRPSTPSWAAKSVLDALSELQRPAPAAKPPQPAAVAVAAPVVAAPAPIAAPLVAPLAAPVVAAHRPMSAPVVPTVAAPSGMEEPQPSWMRQYGGILAIAVGGMILVAGIASVLLRNR
jgi:tRNA A-37 threonylcarbamoyl transferase component Bud32